MKNAVRIALLVTFLSAVSSATPQPNASAQTPPKRDPVIDMLKKGAPFAKAGNRVKYSLEDVSAWQDKMPTVGGATHPAVTATSKVIMENLTEDKASVKIVDSHVTIMGSATDMDSFVAKSWFTDDNGNRLAEVKIAPDEKKEVAVRTELASFRYPNGKVVDRGSNPIELMLRFKAHGEVARVGRVVEVGTVN